MTSVFVGRSGELARLCEVAAAARSRRGLALVVTGIAGVGLTSLVTRAAADVRAGLDAGAEQPIGVIEVIVVQARASERELHRTVLRDLADALVSPELAAAVETAPDAELPARLLEAIGGRAAPVLIIVDDVDGADPASVAALGFAARRVGRLAVSMVFTCRDARADGLGDLPELAVGGLDVSALGAVLAVHAVSGAAIPDSVVSDVHRISGGNPRMALEVIGGLSAAQRSGTEPFPVFPTMAADAFAAVQAPIASLTTGARRALTLAACEPTGDIRVIGRAAATLGVDLSALEEAEESGIVRLEGGSVHFDQPLRRLAAYQAVAAPSRRAAHRALAAALGAPMEAEQRALHLALGTVEPDERIAADVELAAQAAERRGDHGAARRWWLHAARLSPVRADADARERRARTAEGAGTGLLAALTDGERRVAEVVGAGVSNKAAASALHVSVKTIDTHLQSIYRKLGLRSRGELAVVMARLTTGGDQPVASSDGTGPATAEPSRDNGPDGVPDGVPEEVVT